jgi:hypothetical protein
MRLFTRGRVYRHALTLDMDMFIVGRFYNGPDYVTGKVLFINRRTGNVFAHILEPETVRVKIKDFCFWREVPSQ